MGNSLLFLIVLIAGGYLFARIDTNKDKIEYGINKYLYYIALPSIIFIKIYSIDTRFMEFNFLTANVLPVLITYALIFILYFSGLISNLFTRTLIIASSLGNVIYLGLPVVKMLYGENSIGFAALSSAIQNIIIFTVGIILINLIEEDKESFKIIISKLIKNPILISSLTGVIFLALHIKIPYFFENLMTEIGHTTTVLSLFIIGISLYGIKPDLTQFKRVLVISGFKLLIIPLISFFYLYITNSAEIMYKTSFTEFSMPVALSAYIISKEIELDSNLISQSILFSTLIFFLILPLHIYIIKNVF